VNDYCHTLREFVLSKRAGVDLSTFNPRRLVIAGNYSKELTDQKKRSSFELFRASLTSLRRPWIYRRRSFKPAGPPATQRENLERRTYAWIKL
jgi:hypothetical protein